MKTLKKHLKKQYSEKFIDYGEIMLKKIKDIDINYVDYGSGKDTIVLLHGWGQNIEMMKPIGDRLKNNFKIIIIDLPGFGLSEEGNREGTGTGTEGGT